MNFNLRILNLWIGLCRGVPGLPKDVHALGYTDGYIERTFRNQDNEICKPELVISSRAQGHTILFEWKGGANNKDDQLQRYSRLTPFALQHGGALSVQETKSFDVVIVGKAEHADRLKIGIDKNGCSFPLLVVDQSGIRLAKSKLQNERLNAIFTKGLALDFDQCPLNFVPLDAESEPWEVASVIMQEILRQMHLRTPSIKTDVLCNKVFELWSTMQKTAREAAIDKVDRVLDQAASEEFAPYITFTKGKPSVVDFIGNPVDFKADKRSATYRRMETEMRNFIGRLQSGRIFHTEGNLFSSFY